MKKFLIGVIFLIPIVVVVALSATGAIISMTTPVNPTDMVVKNSDNVEIERGVPIKVDSKNFDEFIIIDVLPAITQDKAVTYEVVEEAGDGRVELERIGETNRYSIIPIKIGVCKLEIRAKANVNVFREITIYVTSDSVETMMIYDSTGADVGAYREITKNEKFYVDVNPIDAVRDNDIQWDSSDTNVAIVSENGLVEIKGRGVTRIKVTVGDKDGNSVSDYFDVDTTKAVVTTTQVFVTEAVSVSWIMQNVVLDAEAVVIDNGDGTFTVESEDGVCTITTNVVGESAWVVTDLPDVIYLRNGGYAPYVKNLISGAEIKDYQVEILTPDQIAYEKEMGIFIPLKTGQAVVRIIYGGESQEVSMLIKDNPIAFELELGSGDQKLGIQLSRTWGLYWLDENNNLTTEFKFGLTDKSNDFDVVWSVNDPNFASITRIDGSQDIIINFSENAQGQAVVITATLKVNNLLQERVKRSFTFNIREQKNSINVYNFDQAHFVNAYRFHNIVLQSDIVAKGRLDNISGSVYGNGFKWDASGVEDIDYDDGAIEFDFEDMVGVSRQAEHAVKYQTFLEEGNDSINFEDIVIFNAKTLEEAEWRGSGVRSTSLWHETRSQFDDYPDDMPINFRYLQVYNTHRGIEIGYHYNALVEGCILGDNVDNSIFAYYYNEKERRYPERGNKLTLRNNVFKISTGPSVMLVSVPTDFDKLDSSCNFAPDVTFEGFNDFYNWQRKDEFYDNVAGMIGGYVGMFVDPGSGLGSAINSLLLPVLDDVMKDVSKGDAVQDLYYKYAGEEYVSFGALGIGALFYFDASHVTVESEGLMITDLPFRDSNGKPVGRMQYLEDTLAGLRDTIGLPNATTITNPSTIVCTDFSQGEPEIKPGDPIPNSKELYDKLRGN